MILTIVVLSILLTISISINIYFGIKLDSYIEKLGEYKEWVSNITQLVDVTYKNLKILDDRQIFEKDDDVGFVFSNIVKLIEILKNKI